MEPVLCGHAPWNRNWCASHAPDWTPTGCRTDPWPSSGSLNAMERVLAAHPQTWRRRRRRGPGLGQPPGPRPALGLRTVAVGVDDEGPLPDDVRRVLAAGARALVVTDRA